ncbi:hypothetical protein [Aggregatilinea lenta]|uniref:hypothetical protein n=1 Tax=Aggregatilinea lenta TaxID=913108 RepID=UPI000E5AF8D9|nr:hypothetical protein [Aggregatilinea lenta]
MTSRPNALQLAGLALLSCGSLALEIALTRLLATIYYPQYVFVAISLAVLGIGLGAALASWRPAWVRRVPVAATMSLAGLGALILVAVVVLAAAADLRPLVFALTTLPYLCTGVALTAIFSLASGDSPRLYMADLLGAGAGAVLAIPLLNALGALNGALAAAVLLSLSGILWQRRALPVVLTVGIALALAGNLAAGWLALDMSDLGTNKPVEASLADGALIATEWDSFARTDLIDPGEGRPYQLYVDGAAGSVMPPAGIDQALLRDIGFFPFATAQPERVLVIGPGGGLDVWFGLQSGAREIVAVEVNPASVDLVKSYADYNGDLYGQPNVRVEVDEGRSVLRRENRDYDLIFLSQVVTSTAERSGYVLSESTIYTVEAFGDYLDHLRPDGQIALKLYDEPTLTRALSVAVAAFNARGLSDAEALAHVEIYVDSSADPAIPLLVVRATPFTRNEALADGAVAVEVGFDPLFLPQVLADAPFDAIEAGTTDFDTLIDEAGIDLSAPTDDRPFFFQFERGLPDTLARLLLGIIALIAVGGALLILVQRRSASTGYAWSPLYFAALGAGFISIETTVIQQTRLFLGHPTLAVTTVLAVMLVGGGLGSWMAGRWIEAKPGRVPALPAAGVALVLVFWALTWPVIGDSFQTAGQALRVTMAAVTLLPLALLMGMPFPLGLKALDGAGARRIPLAWAVNGIATVFGSVGATALAMLAGFNSVLVASAVVYLLAGLLARWAVAPPTVEV